MLCRLCTELELFLQTAQQPDASASGLTEAGRRNRAQQREEKIQRAKLDIERHQKAVHSN